MFILFSGFKTNKTEMNAVFDLFDRENRDFIEYQEFIEAMKPKRHVSIDYYYLFNGFHLLQSAF